MSQGSIHSDFASGGELARFSELVDLIYQGATDPARWEIVVPAIADWVGAERGLLHTPLTSPAEGGFFFHHPIDDPALSPRMMQLWWSRYREQDIWAIRSIERGLVHESNVIVGDDLVPFDELASTAIYQEFLAKIDLTHLLSGIVFGPQAEAHPYVVCTLFRRLRSGRFHERERDRLALLIPHLSRALAVMTRLRRTEMAAATNLSLLDRLNTAALLLDAKARVGFVNRAARRVLEEEDGLLLRSLPGDVSLGQLAAGDASSSGALASALRDVVSPDLLHATHFSQAVTVARPSGRPAYVLHFSPLAAHNEFGTGTQSPRAIVFITDGAAPIRIDGALFRTTYGLTPAELRLTEVLSDGLTVEEAAERMGISRSTVKTQLQSIYAKTGTHNRATLMKLLVSLAQAAG